MASRAAKDPHGYLRLFFPTQVRRLSDGVVGSIQMSELPIRYEFKKDRQPLDPFTVKYGPEVHTVKWDDTGEVGTITQSEVELIWREGLDEQIERIERGEE